MKKVLLALVMIVALASRALAFGVVIDVRSERGVQRDIQGNYYSYPGEKIIHREVRHTCGTQRCRTYIVEERQLKWNGHWINP